MAKLIFRQSPVKSWNDLKKGFDKLTPMDHAVSKRSGHFWGMLGASTASLSLLLQVPFGDKLLPTTSTLGFGILVGAISYLQFCEWRKENQKISGLEKMNEITKGLEAV